MYYQQFMDAIDRQVQKTVNCTGHLAFKKDIKNLKTAITGCGLSAITADVWLKELREAKDEELISYVEKYKAGTLDAWKGYK